MTALRQQGGLGPGSEMTVHVFAHSMGALVARWLAEIAGGDELVDRMILVGPPNRGSTLASMSRGGAYLLAAILNGLSPVPLAGAAGWALKELFEQAHGWRDL